VKIDGHKVSPLMIKILLEMVKDRIGYKAIGRKVSGTDGEFVLKENISPYSVKIFGRLNVKFGEP
jgi:hypothetical protein